MENQFNKFQSSIEDLNIDNYPQEIKEAFYDFLTNVPYIKSLISPDRPYAKDCPRDKEGKIIVDLTNPPIIEDTDYFRPNAIHYKKYGNLTNLRPNPNPNSEYGRWVREEVRRIFFGYVRESDGAWVTGDMYFFLNYCPIIKVKRVKGKQGVRVVDFPDFLEGQWLKFMYIKQARDNAKHGSELASRGKGKSYTMASILARRFILGEYNPIDKKIEGKVESFVASYLKNYLNEDGVLNKFESYIDFCSENTEFPKKRLTSSINQMHWQMGYKENESVAKKGTLNEVIGVSVKDSPGKLRGKRGAFIGLEEFGSFPNLIELYGTLRPSMEDGDIVFGMIYCQGTAGDKESDFSAAQKIMYSPRAFNMQPIPNVYDKLGQGKQEFVYFYPAYVNRNGCYNKDGISDVTKAILEVLINRYNVKYNTTDANLIIKTIAEQPIVPQEAIMRTRGNLFPVQTLNERINQLDNNPNIYDDIYIGNLNIQRDGTVKFSNSIDQPIREYPLNDNSNKGAIEIFEMPQKDSNGRVFQERYIMGLDPVDDDVAHTTSLTSVFVLDLLTDRIVAEYTGRQEYADDNFEIVRRLCLFYNAKCLYESNKKGIFAYFNKMNALQYLAETPVYLKDQQIIKEIGYGNKSRGVNASAAVNSFADRLTREWLIKPVQTITVQDEQEVQVTLPNLMFVRNRAFLQELVAYDPKGNFDRIRAFGMLMLYRQEKIILYQGDMNKTINEDKYKDLAENDEFFTQNFDERFEQSLFEESINKTLN